MNTKNIIPALCLLLAAFMPASAHGEDQFTIAPVYEQNFFKNDYGTEYLLHSPGISVSFVRDSQLDLLFSFTAFTPVWLSENGETSISYEYYNNPGGIDLHAGPVWFFPMGETMVFEPSLGLHSGFISLTGTGYQSIQFAPLGIGTDLRIKAHIREKLSLGLLLAGKWNLVDLMHINSHDTGYSITAGISAGFRFESGRVAKKQGNRS